MNAAIADTGPGISPIVEIPELRTGPTADDCTRIVWTVATDQAAKDGVRP